MFVDSVKIDARAGRGGGGCVAFLREAFRPKGGPCGGNGGRGGDVFLEADINLNNLIDRYYHPHLHARNGEPGSGKGRDGKNAKSLIAKVPCGTLVWKLPREKDHKVHKDQIDHQVHEVQNDQKVQNDHCENRHDAFQFSTPVADLLEHGQRFLLAKGGRGGLGNRHFATARRQSPRFAQPGEFGTQDRYYLELRVIAEIGFVGYPNAGKSSLLSALSRARPKIADYPFTTLTPHIGVLEHEDHTRTSLCDIPGIIEGAHRNAGLGHAFLRHLERCQALAFVIDMAGKNGRKPWEDYVQLRMELKAYDPSLLKRRAILLANKMDEPSAAEHLARFREEVKQKVKMQMMPTLIPISAVFGEGLDEVKKAFHKIAKR